MSKINFFALVLAAALFGIMFPDSPALAQRGGSPHDCPRSNPDCRDKEPEQEGTMKWHPGHYVKTQGQHCAMNQDVYYDGVMRNLNAHVESSDKFRGAYVIYAWGALETDKGVYDWSRVHEHLDWLAATGKHLLVGIEHKCYGGMTDPEWLVPENLETAVEPHMEGIIGALWRTEVMDQYLDFVWAFAAEFDSHPNVEMVSFVPETCPGFGSIGLPSGYNNTGYSEQIQRMVSAAALAFGQTAVSVGVNCPMNGEAVNLVEALYQNGLGRAGPDAHAVPGYNVFTGDDGALRDYRGQIPHRVIVSAPNLGGFSNILPLSNIQKLIDDGSVTHAAWVLSSSTQGGTKDNIIEHIKKRKNGTFTKCPAQFETLYGGCQQ
jgi:hypothetical protein